MVIGFGSIRVVIHGFAHRLRRLFKSVVRTAWCSNSLILLVFIRLYFYGAVCQPVDPDRCRRPHNHLDI